MRSCEVKRLPLSRRGRTVLLTSAAGLAAATALYGHMVMSNPDWPGQQDIKVAVVQGNIEIEKKWDPKGAESIVQTYIELSGQAAQEEPALPPGLEDSAQAQEEPALPPGLAPTEDEEEPALPEGLGEEPAKEVVEAAPSSTTEPPFDLSGFWESRLGARTQRDHYERDLSIGETRLQLEIEKN